jgi:photosystem II stability/assembly factor-like uncharacterized protein
MLVAHAKLRLWRAEVGKTMASRHFSVQAFGVVLLACAAVLAQHPARHTKPLVAAKPSTASAADYKGIFEPVNYTEDVNLTDVFFTGVDEGWTAGDHGTILHTGNGGQTWTAQLGGNPQSTEPQISMLRFVDSRHGWAVLNKDVGGGKHPLLQTRDGQHWVQIGAIPFGYGLVDYQFSTTQNGAAIVGNGNGAEFWHTRDAGRTWKQVVPWGGCHAKININGLWRDAQCEQFELKFVSPTVAYAVGCVSYCSNTLFLGKTTDGGNTWAFWGMQVTTLNGSPSHAVFFDENRALVFVSTCCDTQIFATEDGARSWYPSLATTNGDIRFADPAVAWGLATHRGSGTLYYTVNGGQQWGAQQISLPAEISAFSFPRRDRAYVVGEHGMVYRYRIVPKAYSASNAVDGPVMPGVGDPVLQARTQRVRDDIAALQAKLSAAMARSDAGASSSAGSVSSPASATPDGGDASASTNTGGDSSASTAMSSDTSGASSSTSAPDLTSGTAATPDGNLTSTSNSTGASTSADTANANSDPASGVVAGATDTTSAPAFDNTAPSAPVTACCAAQVQALQNDVGGLTQQLPIFAGKFRSLNMIVAGLQIVSDLLNKAQAMRETFRTLKHAPSLQAASAALMQLASNVQSTQQNITAELQNPGSVTLPASDASTPVAAQAFAQSADTAAQPAADSQPGAAAQAGAPAAVPQSTAPAATPSSDSSSNSGTVTQTANKAVDKAKDKVKKTLGGWIPH